MTGGRDTNMPLKISRVNPGSNAEICGLREGDVITRINGAEVEGLTKAEAQKKLKRSKIELELKVHKKMDSSREGQSSGTVAESTAFNSDPNLRDVENNSQVHQVVDDNSQIPSIQTPVEVDVEKSSKSHPVIESESAPAPVVEEKEQKVKKSPEKKKKIGGSLKRKKSKDKDKEQQSESSPEKIVEKSPKSKSKSRDKEKGVCNGTENFGVKGHCNGHLESVNGGGHDGGGSMLGEIIAELDDLLETPYFNDTLQGVWSPGVSKTLEDIEQESVQKISENPAVAAEKIPPVWTPTKAPPSPKQFRPVNFKAPPTSPKPTRSIERSSSHTGIVQENSPLQSPSGSVDQRLPKYQNPTVTLLQKAREGQLPKGASYLENQQKVQKSAGNHFNHDTIHENSLFEPKKPSRRYEGIGHTTYEGVPTALRSIVKNDAQHEWYKRMYESLHVDRPRTSKPGKYLKVKYKLPGQCHLSSDKGYESDTFAYKSQGLDRRKAQQASWTEFRSPSATPQGIRFNPGKIEDYTPGNSNFAAKEIRRHQPTLHWALGGRKELSGYESDSNVIIRRRIEEESPPPPLSPAEARAAYAEIQRGGEVPLKGLRKAIPDKSKEQASLLSRILSMPSFQDMKRLIPSRRSQSPSTSSLKARSPSPVEPHSKTAVLRERIQGRLRRTSSDLGGKSEKPSEMEETVAPKKSQSFGKGAASRLIHTVRSKTVRKSPESDLQSPKEVKKALKVSEESVGETHKLQVKLEVVKNATVKKLKSDKSGKKVGKSGKNVKIVNNLNGNGNGGPSKPPRKLNNGRLEEVTPPPPLPPPLSSSMSKASIRHAGCLSPSGSRPTSPSQNTRKSPEGSANSKIPILVQKSKNFTNGSGKITRAKSAAALESIKELQKSIIESNTRLRAGNRKSPGPYSYPYESGRRSRGQSSEPDDGNFRSLPALTPYLRETKRVSRSAFKTNLGQQVRPTKTSSLREKIVNESEKLTLDRKKVAKLQPQGQNRGGQSQRSYVKRSISCLGPKESQMRDYCYTKYILELQHSRKRSPRFEQLHRLYSSLERLGQLEKSTSLFNISVMSPERTAVDFDSWWKLRNRLRIDEEIDYISTQLEEAQKNREFYFRPRKVDDFRWKGDSGLRIKKWSIEELRNFLLSDQMHNPWSMGNEKLFQGFSYLPKIRCGSADVHKTSWRGQGVKEVALNLEVSALNKQYSDNFIPGSGLRRAFSMSSTLSEDQRESVKGRLRSLLQEKPTPRPKETQHERKILTTRMGHNGHVSRAESDRAVGSDGHLTENYKRALSRTLSQEFKEFKERKRCRESLQETPKTSKVPISTQVLLQRYEDKLKNRKNGKKLPYSYYCAKGVPSKVTFFESAAQNQNKENEEIEGKNQQIKPIVKVSQPLGSGSRPRSRSPIYNRIRSRSASPSEAYDMSHVNVISKLASLLLKGNAPLKNLLRKEIQERDKIERLRRSQSGEVDRLKYLYESYDALGQGQGSEINLLKCLFCSDPDLARESGKIDEYRRSASADLFKKTTRKRPEGRECSPDPGGQVDQTAELLFTKRSRKPIYSPSTIPNTCPKPTLTAHCYLDPPGFDHGSLQSLSAGGKTTEPPLSSSEYASGLGWDFQSTISNQSRCYSMLSVPSPSPPFYNNGAGGNSEMSWSSCQYQSPCPLYYQSLDRQTVRNRPSRTVSQSSLKNYDPKLHQPRFRYVPPQRENLPPPTMNLQPSQSVGNINTMVLPPRPPLPQYLYRSQNQGGVEQRGVGFINNSQLGRSQSLNQKQSESQIIKYPAPRPNYHTMSSPGVRYSEGQVNIHYKAPIRLEEKRYVSEEELRRRQVANMHRFYEQQRHRKYLQELQDVENRRHTDNFTPSQKSPIPLNRYEDFSQPQQPPKWREKTPERTKLVAKALYSFQAQNARELSFLKGDILYIRRSLDANWYEGEHNAAIGIFPTSYVQVIPNYEISLIGERATPRIPTEGQAKVRFTFSAATPAEMSIIKGETIVLCRRVDHNWYEGRIGSRRGIFPASYIQVLKEPGLSGSDPRSASCLSPKPVGSPAAHSLISDPARSSQHPNHKYRPTDYDTKSIIADINNDFHAFTNSRPGSSLRSPSPYKSQQSRPVMTNGGRNGGLHHNLSIDTRVEPLLYRALYNYRPQHDDELELRENDMVQVLEKCDDGWFVGTSQRTGLFGTFPGNYIERVF